MLFLDVTVSVKSNSFSLLLSFKCESFGKWKRNLFDGKVSLHLNLTLDGERQHASFPFREFVRVSLLGRKFPN